MTRLFSCVLFVTTTLLWGTATVYGQETGKMNLILQAELQRKDGGGEVDIFLRGDADALRALVRQSGGRVKAQVGNVLSVSMPANAVGILGASPAVDYIGFARSNPQVLSDPMIVHNNVFPVHAGASPLPQAYFGDDVVVGLIDTGIELEHPDFQHPDGSTRVVALWDQTQAEIDPFRVPQPYGYGQEWTAEDIDAGITGHDDQAAYYGHGSTVAGVAAGNAGATGHFMGVAPHADLVVVSSDLERDNWSASVADAVAYIFARAEALGKPAVVNLSLGDYFGSHDGLDAATLIIDSLLNAAPGRVLVAAAGNSGNFPPYHLGYDVPTTDTAFTWMRYNPNSLLGEGAVFFELWADTADFGQTSFAIGADATVPEYEFRGWSAWRNAADNLDQTVVDTLFWNGNVLGIADTWCGLRGGQYQIQVSVRQAFSSHYNWRFATTGGGRFDLWSYAPFGTSTIEYADLPGVAEYPPMDQYRLPDNHSSMVDAWACSDKVITVGNYVNRDRFANYGGDTTFYNAVPGSISVNSSRGPTRDLRLKPDVAATGDVTLSAGRLATLNLFINTDPAKVAEDGWHYVNGGTSIASPVVAGIAALYLSRDPQATAADIKQALVENAIADPYTGPLPNDRFGHGKVDAFATLVQPFVVSVRAESSRELMLFPNPAADVLYLGAGDKILDQVEVYDLSGRRMLRARSTGHQGDTHRLTLPDLPAGAYVLKVDYEDGTRGHAKFIVAH